jgi:hypothetical protein
MTVYDNSGQSASDRCSVCGLSEDSENNDDNPFIRCAICSSQLHEGCYLVGNPSDPSAPVICSICVKVGIGEKNERATSSSALSPGNWAFVFFPEEKWLKGLSISVNPTDSTVVLMKFEITESSSSSLSSSSSSTSSVPSYRWINLEKMIVYPFLHQSLAAADDDADDDGIEDDNDNVESSQPKRKRRRMADDNHATNNNHNEGSNGMTFPPSSPMKKNESRSITASSSPSAYHLPEGMTDTYLSANSLKAALCAAGTVCKGVDLVASGENINAFACIRPPGKTSLLVCPPLLMCFYFWFPSIFFPSFSHVFPFRSSLWSKWLYKRFFKYRILSIE